MAPTLARWSACWMPAWEWGCSTSGTASYANQPVAETYLCDRSPLSLTGYVLYSNEALFPMWAHLEDAVREGTHRWTQTFGWQGSLFEHFFKTDARRRSFLRGMHGFGLVELAGGGGGIRSLPVPAPG
jgi:acetylserotonin O-methyltransferase